MKKRKWMENQRIRGRKGRRRSESFYVKVVDKFYWIIGNTRQAG